MDNPAVPPAWQTGLDALQAGRGEEAVAALREVVQSDPDGFEGNMFLGIALAQTGRHSEAIPHLEKAAGLQPGHAQVHYNLGVAQLALQQTEAARVSFTEALRLNPDYPAAAQALASLPPTMPAALLPVPPGLSATDYLRATGFGLLAAVIGAFIWDKFVYYTNIQFGLIAVGVGVLVGVAVAMGANGKHATGLQVLGALLATFGMLLGHAMIGADVIAAQLVKEGKNVPPYLVRVIIGAVITPTIIIQDPLTLVFIAFGAYEGWKIPGARDHSGAA